MKRALADRVVPQNTTYCFTSIRSKDSKYIIKPCPYYEYRKNRKHIYVGFCTLLNEFLSVENMKKACDINTGEDD